MSGARAGWKKLRHTRTLVEVKTKSCDDKYPGAPGDPAAVTKKLQKEVNDDYHKRAKKLDEKLGTAAGVKGPFANELNQYGKKGRVTSPVVGAFAEMSLDTDAIADLVASILAEEHRFLLLRQAVRCEGHVHSSSTAPWASQRTSAGRASSSSTATETSCSPPPQPASIINTTGLTTLPPTTKMHSRTGASSIPTPHPPNR
jgi:hypothetical protein